MNAKPPPPSTTWSEAVSADEPARFDDYVRRFEAMQAAKSARFGAGRALHRKGLGAAYGTLQVLDGLPPFCRFGLFHEARNYEVWVRISNGSADRASDRRPDVRGFSLRAFGVTGWSALGNGPAVSQDFTLINQEVFPFPDSRGFVDLVGAAADGPSAVLRHLVRRHGLIGGAREAKRLVDVARRPFTGFATENFHSVVPMACGPYAVRVRLMPAARSNGAPARGSSDWGADFARRLKRAPLHWDLQLQYFVDEKTTPIEDASAAWSTPHTTVARLMLPPQDTSLPAGVDLQAQVEASVFDPWQALVDHRPLGEVQRARKAVYFASQKARDAV